MIVNRVCACGEALDFESARCGNCNRMVAFDPATRNVLPLSADTPGFQCANASACRCNWLAEEEGSLCYSCRLTKIIPPQNMPEMRSAWRRFERAKRRLVAGLLRLRMLPAYERDSNGNRLEINMLVDRESHPNISEEFVLTGHSEGVITINAKEADHLKVESTRLEFREPYRTLLGSLRHESGHYFWYALIAADPGRLASFREVFGDERTDYEEALRVHYNRPSSHRTHKEYISGYAQAHPYEDWAETWAHHLHIGDMLSAASSAGLVYASENSGSFEAMLERFRYIARVANALNRALGHRSAFPFSYTPEVVEKLRFVAQVVAEAQERLAPLDSRSLNPALTPG